MTVILHYKTKKELKQNIGQPLNYTETSIFGAEYKSNGTVIGTNHPKRSWFSKITIENDLIKRVD
tara:strand:+ start:262 stop:456 length:195 start_codon:yes stop_codon:yes gene_type:complete